MSKKILLVTRYFPPIDTIAAQRMSSWARYLTESGYNVTVLTPSKDGQVVHPTLPVPGVRVLEVPYWDPMTFLGFDKRQMIEKTEQLSRKSSFLNACKTFYRHRLNHRMPSRTDPWIFSAIRQLKKIKKEGETFDIVISSYGPPAPLIVGSYAKKLFRSQWVVDYRDLWIESHICFGLWPFTVFEKWLEKKIIPKATVITTVSEGLQEILQQKFPHIPVHVVTNGFDQDLMDQASSQYFSKLPPKLRLVYTGSLFSFLQDPAPLYQALLELDQEIPNLSNHLEILFYGRIPQDRLQQIDKMGVSHLVHFQGYVSQEESRSIQQSADLLLFLLSPNPQIKGVMTGKLFEYLYAQPPILAIGSPKDYCPNRLIAKTQSGFNCGTDVQKIKKVIKSGLNKKPQVNKDRNTIMRYSRKEQAHRLIQLL